MEADLEILEKVKKRFESETFMFFIIFEKKIGWLWLIGNETFNWNGL